MPRPWPHRPGVAEQAAPRFRETGTEMTVRMNQTLPASRLPFWGQDGKVDGVQVLLVGAKPQQAQALQANLEARGFGVLLAGNAIAALKLLTSQDPDIILLDSRALGSEDDPRCSDLLLRICQSSPTPVIVLADPLGVAAPVIGLKMGADDYMVKPIGIRELVARMQAILRRVGSG